jgi:hypothetical protein
MIGRTEKRWPMRRFDIARRNWLASTRSRQQRDFQACRASRNNGMGTTLVVAMWLMTHDRRHIGIPGFTGCAAASWSR